MKNDDTPKKNLILRDLLAIDRTKMANQRTLMAFIATGLHFVIMGITIAKVEAFNEVAWLAVPFIALAVISWLVGGFSYYKNHRSISRAYSEN